MNTTKRFIEMELGSGLNKSERRRLAKSAAAGTSARLRMTMQGKAILPEIENPSGEQYLRGNRK